jgi:molybdenum cofactor biosynthesis enzyme MoaA
MKIATFTVVCGSDACNAQCPFCVSKMTAPNGVTHQVDCPNLRNLIVGCRVAEKNNVTTALITGKGEPTLFPDLVSFYINKLSPFFPIIEMQSNAIVFENWNRWRPTLKRWYEEGLSLISVSIAHPDIEKNAEIFRPSKVYDYWEIISNLKEIGFSVRLNCTCVKGYCDEYEIAKQIIDKCRDNEVEQLTFRDVATPDESENAEVFNWTKEHQTNFVSEKLYGILKFERDEILELPHGGLVYDVDGQNVCLGNCLTESKNPDDIRQLIYFPDGHLRYSWQNRGAIIL